MCRREFTIQNRRYSGCRTGGPFPKSKTMHKAAEISIMSPRMSGDDDRAFGIAIMLSAILAPILKKTGSAARKLY